MKKLLFFFLLITILPLARGQEAPEGLFISSRAPDFKATDQHGTELRLKDLVKKGKVVLVFYRGYWCPHCNRFLKKLEDSLQLVRDKGATLLAITPEKPENISKTIEKTKAGFSILFDSELEIMKAYDVDHEQQENTITRYRNTGIDLEKNNGKNWKFLPIPAVYIIDREMTVTYRFFEKDYKKRPSVKEILDNLEKGL
jgi:peroxiredoxin